MTTTPTAVATAAATPITAVTVGSTPDATATATGRMNAAAALRLARHLLQPMILLTVAAPLLAYEILTALGLSELTALAAGSLFPLVGLLIGAVRSRRLEWFALASLAGIAIGLTGGFLLHSAQFLLVKDSIITGGIGLVFLASLATSRPLIYIFARQMAADPAARDRFEQRWTRQPQLRASITVMTGVWGVGLLAEAGLRVGLSFLLTPATLLAISPLLAAAVFAPLAIWTLRRRAAAQHNHPA